MFGVVSPGSKSGDGSKPSTATSTSHGSQPASRIVADPQVYEPYKKGMYKDVGETEDELSFVPRRLKFVGLRTPRFQQLEA